MERLSLNGQWEMCCTENYDWIGATVPGSVYADFMGAGKMEDPFWRDNETKALEMMQYAYEYRRSFTVSDDMLSHDAVELYCAGLDTVATIYVNNQKAGYADNMHREWVFNIKPLLKCGENTLLIHFDSPTEYIKESYKKNPNKGSDYAMEGFSNLRKSHHMFGWDWGPRLPDAGIWKDIALQYGDAAVFESVYIRQKHSENSVELTAETLLKPLTDGGSLDTQVYFTVINPQGEAVEAVQGTQSITIADPQLWWPHGYGAQPLYSVTVTLKQGERVLDVWTRRIGLRTMGVRREKDEWGESFAHEVNGITIFAMGADYIPEDNILSRVTPERTRRLLEDCIAANFNTVRVWGGGCYPSDDFYNCCDELGLLVWQDMMFACAIYGLTREFEGNVCAELTDNVRRLRHHPSLGLWCGNNEMELFVAGDVWIDRPAQKAEYLQMYEYIFPKLMRELDPDNFYWPASPSSGGSFDDPNDPNRGDVHYWEVWHGGKPFTEYRKFFFRYASEFGFQSFPCLKTVESFTLPEDRNIFSYVMEKHQRNSIANGKIMNYLSQTFLYPKEFDTLLYASQLLQAEAIRYGVEHWRRNRGRCMGAIYWQLNDCWPVASWASIDYFGRWKALHYAAKRFFAPVLLSCEEEGLLSQTEDVNPQPFVLKKSARLSVQNETMDYFVGKVKWSLRTADARIAEQGSVDITVAPLTSEWIRNLDFPLADPYRHYLSYELYASNGEVISGQSVLFCPPKHFHFVDPKLTATVEGDTITVTASAYARSIEIVSQDEDILLSDNFFDVDAGVRIIKILRGSAKRLTLRSVYDIK